MHNNGGKTTYYLDSESSTNDNGTKTESGSISTNVPGWQNETWGNGSNYTLEEDLAVMEEEDLAVMEEEDLDVMEEEDEYYLPQIGYSALGVSGVVVGAVGIGILVKSRKKKMNKAKRLRILSNTDSHKAILLQSHTL
jgi:hypothetical protein